MNIQLKTTSKGHRLILSGDIGFDQIETLYQTAKQVVETPHPTTIDWENLHSIHYAGVQVLVALAQSLRNHQKPVRVKEPAPELYEQLRRYGIWQALLTD